MVKLDDESATTSEARNFDRVDKTCSLAKDSDFRFAHSSYLLTNFLRAGEKHSRQIAFAQYVVVEHRDFLDAGQHDVFRHFTIQTTHSNQQNTRSTNAE